MGIQYSVTPCYTAMGANFVQHVITLFVKAKLAKLTLSIQYFDI